MKLLFSICLFMAFASCEESSDEDKNPVLIDKESIYFMPDESLPHEGTWLQWPHEYQYGKTYRNRLDATWVSMAAELVSSEKVHLIAYDNTEKERILELLKAAKVPLENIDFNILKTDDVWVRDNGPIYVKDKSGNLAIEDWGFNGWGNKAKYANCNKIPNGIGAMQKLPVVDINSIMINEGGALEIDGNGTMLATKSAILNKNRNPNMSQLEAEGIFTKYLGVSNFIWLEGQSGLEITDQHIDGFARFGNSSTIVTMEPADLLNYDVKQSDIDILFKAKNVVGKAYTFFNLPLTKKDVITEYGKNLGYKGSYVNYYIANTKVLVPNYNDENDNVANAIIQSLYPTRKVVGIDVRNLYENGGMVHCVTQQQPK